MPFVTIEDVREELNLYDESEIPDGLITDSLTKAHGDILGGTLLTDESETTGQIESAESRLAASHVFQKLAVSTAVSAREWRASKLSIDEIGRMQNLMKVSQELWEESWSLLRPYLRVPEPAPLIVTKGATS